MGLNTVCFTLLWRLKSDRKQKRGLIAPDPEKEENSIVKWIECNNLGRPFVTHFTAAVDRKTPWHCHRDAEEFLGPYFRDYYSYWDTYHVYFCTLNEFFSLKNDADERERFAQPNQDRRNALRKAQEEYTAAEIERNLLWYWPFGFAERETRFLAAQAALFALERDEAQRKQRCNVEFIAKMEEMEQFVLGEMGGSVETFERENDAQEIGIAFISY